MIGERPTAETGLSWETARELMRRRRSNLQIDPERPIERGLINQLLELATWAPNHKLTRPWRFTLLTGAARARLGELAAEGLLAAGPVPPAKLEGTRVKYLRAPAILVVGSAQHEDPVLHRENRDAVAAGVENLLLGATALGLASYWASGPLVDDPAVKRYVGLTERDEIVAIIYLGWPAADCPPHPPRTPELTSLES